MATGAMNLYLPLCVCVVVVFLLYFFTCVFTRGQLKSVMLVNEIIIVIETGTSLASSYLTGELTPKTAFIHCS